jgi:IS4 transposase
MVITDGKVHEVTILDTMIFQAGAYDVMDRGYLDFERFYKIHQSKAFFVTRAKKNTKWKRRYSNHVDKSTGIQGDQIVVFAKSNRLATYPEPLRRIRFYDAERNKQFVFLTNNMTLPALMIAKLYKLRWRVELFFKWIKQHLRIKVF